VSQSESGELGLATGLADVVEVAAAAGCGSTDSEYGRDETNR
jgi:hypothetical protein